MFVDEMLGRAGQLRRCSNLQEHFDNIYNNHLVKKRLFLQTLKTQSKRTKYSILAIHADTGFDGRSCEQTDTTEKWTDGQ